MEILFCVGSHAARQRVWKQLNLNSHELRNQCFMADSLFCMYLIDRFLQLLRCEVPLSKYLRYQDCHALYLQDFISNRIYQSTNWNSVFFYRSLITCFCFSYWHLNWCFLGVIYLQGLASLPSHITFDCGRFLEITV